MSLRTWMAVGGPAVLAATTLSITGCGASSSIDPVAQAAELTAQQSGARISLTEQLSGAGLPAGVTITGTGYVNQHTRDSLLTLDLAGIPGLGGAGASSVTIEMHYPIMYMRFPALSSQLPGNKEWVKLDLAAVAQAQGINLTQLSAGGGVDPSQYLDYLRASGSQITTVGADTVDGVATTHYRAVIDLSRVARAVPSADRAATAAAIAQLEKVSGIHTFPIDVWVDAQHRVRREQFAITSGGSTGHPVAVKATVDYLSFGPNPSVVPPPADSVFDLTSLVQSGALSSSQSGSTTSQSGSSTAQSG